eukprot:6189289-Pleurochrysis_carterae.AAC.4
MNFVRAQNRARDAARSSGQAVARASDSNTGVEHYRAPPRAIGNGVSGVSRYSGRDMVDASTPSEPLDWLAQWKVTIDVSTCRMMRDMKIGRGSRGT